MMNYDYLDIYCKKNGIAYAKIRDSTEINKSQYINYEKLNVTMFDNITNTCSNKVSLRIKVPYLYNGEFDPPNKIVMSYNTFGYLYFYGGYYIPTPFTFSPDQLKYLNEYPLNIYLVLFEKPYKE